MSTDAIVLLKDDHREVKALFRRFEKVKENPEKMLSLVQECCRMLVVHSKLEEEIFYPLARREIDEEDLILEAGEEHHVVDVLIEELQGLEPTDEAYAAKFTVLKELVSHHIDEEEDELFPKVRDAAGRKELQEAGEQMLARREDLEKQELVGTGTRTRE